MSSCTLQWLSVRLNYDCTHSTVTKYGKVPRTPVSYTHLFISFILAMHSTVNVCAVAIYIYNHLYYIFIFIYIFMIYVYIYSLKL